MGSSPEEGLVKQRNSLGRLAAVAPGIVLVLASWGCVTPTEPTTLTLDAQVVAPDVYYVIDDGDALLRYAWPERGERGTWLATADADADWFDGPGWYVVDDAGTWVPEPALAELTLDDALQVYDAAPAAP